MNMTRTIIRAALVLAVLTMSACKPESGGESPAAARAAEPATMAAEPAQMANEEPSAVSELAGTSWRLLNITSMDDSIDVPDDPAKYTLEFGVDGSAAMIADCNRGSGSWASESAGQLQFGPVAATMAMCPPGTLSEKYLAQFQWVRSYVLKEGHLFLATMADGSIIEFASAAEAPLAATVLGEEVRTADADEMQQTIITRLFDQYTADHGIVATDTEIQSFVENLQRGMAAEGLAAEEDLTPEEAAEVEVMRTDMARSIIRQWKLNRELYSQYGGRIIYQQLGPEPLDAYRQFFEEQQSAGAFTILDPSMKEVFWRYFTDESMHTFMEPGGADESHAFAIPPWENQSAGE